MNNCDGCKNVNDYWITMAHSQGPVISSVAQGNLEMYLHKDILFADDLDHTFEKA